MWLYKIGDSPEIHGPYDSLKMAQWKKMGYFNNQVQFAKVVDLGQEWVSEVDF